jgi:hypothetical protein
MNAPLRPTRVEKMFKKLMVFVEKISSFACQIAFNKFSTPAFHSAFRILHFGGFARGGDGIE